MISFRPIFISIIASFLMILSAKAETWDMPMAYAATNYHSETAASFAECVDEKADGLEIKTYPGGALFEGYEIKQAVQSGEAKIGERLLSAHADENPLFGVDSIPFLATSYEQSEKLWRAIGDQLQAALAEQNLVYIYSVPWPPQSLYVNKEVEALSDLKGVKFRVYNQVTARLAELAEMIPVPVEAADLAEALTTGEAESFISSGSTGYARKFWNQLSHFYDVQAWLPRNVVFANKQAWDRLSEQVKGAVLSCGEEAAERGEAKSRALTEFYLKRLSDNGMNVSEPSDQLSKELNVVGETLTQEWLEGAGEPGKKAIETYRKM